MSILWCGGEDIDFQSGSAVTVDLSGGRFRSGYARCALYPTVLGGIALGTPFPGGPVTSGWFTVRAYTYNNQSASGYLGITRSGTGGKGLYIGNHATTGKVTLYKFDGTTWTQLQAEAGTTLGASSAIFRFDIQIQSYGSNATVKVYVNGVEVITYTGDVTVTGVTNLDQFAIRYPGAFGYWSISECIAADEDTRTMSLASCYPNAAGESNTFTAGTYVLVSEATQDDTTVLNSQTQDQVSLIACSDLPAGSAYVRAMRVVTRACKGATGIGSVNIGMKVGGTLVAGVSGVGVGGGGGAAVEGNRKDARKFTPTESGQIGFVRVNHYTGANAATKFRVMVYADSAGSPGALLGQSNEYVGHGASEIRDYVLTAPVAMTAGVPIWVALMSDVGYSIVQDSGATTKGNANTYSNGPSDPFGASTSGYVIPIQPLKASQSANYSADLALSTGFDTKGILLHTNPNTGAAFTPVEVNAIQIALRSRP